MKKYQLIQKTNNHPTHSQQKLMHWLSHHELFGDTNGKLRDPVCLAGSGKSSLVLVKSNQIKSNKTYIMKIQNQILKWLGVLLLIVAASVGATAQTLPSSSLTQTVCPGTEPYEVVPGDPNNTFTWLIDGNLTGNGWTIVSGANDYTIEVIWENPATTTVYELTLQEDDPNGCLQVVSLEVTVNPAPAAPTVSTPVEYCLDETAVALTATGTNLLWYTAATGGTGSTTAPTPSTASAGNTSYWVSQTNGNNCEGPREEIVVIINDIPTPSISGLNPACTSRNGSTETYSVVNTGNTFTWSVVGGTFTGQGTNQIEVTWTTSGSGTVSIEEKIDATGCIGTDILDVTIYLTPQTSPIYHN